MVLVIDLDVYSLRPSIPYHSGNGFHGDVMGCTEESSCKIWGYIHFLYMYITDVLIFKYIYIYRLGLQTHNGDILEIYPVMGWGLGSNDVNLQSAGC